MVFVESTFQPSGPFFGREISLSALVVIADHSFGENSRCFGILVGIGNFWPPSLIPLFLCGSSTHFIWILYGT
ncbi:hypothetical protein AQUCO_00400189v1 [Aquilegia coerulea]|uniref:Uncharacterized protein n=1 Tax=Aquilegia coerulea TaxID=218851 RepID=A0A2G5ETU6_AQUCA|nr:hypothetical protein AQUCO_00400189v1 [Aquilegia coerulea]